MRTQSGNVGAYAADAQEVALCGRQYDRIGGLTEIYSSNVNLEHINELS